LREKGRQDYTLIPTARGPTNRVHFTHHALATLNEVIAGSKTGWVLEADLKNFLGASTMTGCSVLLNIESVILA